jgi:hypothetical protein
MTSQDRASDSNEVEDPASKSNVRDLEAHRELILELAREVDRQRESYTARSDSMTTRLSILVAAATITATLQLDQQRGPSVLYILAVVFAGMSALVAGWALWPRNGPENGVAQLMRELWGFPEMVALYALVDRKLDILKADEAVLTRRGSKARWAFISLGLSFLFTALHLIVS